jgi:hypothetical protein
VVNQLNFNHITLENSCHLGQGENQMIYQQKQRTNTKKPPEGGFL